MAAFGSGRSWSNFPVSLSVVMDLKQHLDYLFNPQSVAVIGASNVLGKWGFHILSLLLGKGGREIYAINRNESEVQGLKAYPSMREVPGPVDFAVITVPFQDVPVAMEDCVRKGVKAAVIISGGLAEIGGEGARIEQEVVEIARRGGIRFVGPNCMGHFDSSSDFFTVPYLPPVKKGSLALITQSGNTSQTIVYLACEVGLGFSKYISSGNEADLHFEDYLEYLAQDDETEVILGYVEGLREGRRFFELAKEITKKKPIVIMKAGGTEAGARAARSHTAALAGSDVVCEAAFKQSGVIRVEEVSELIDVALVLLGQPLPRGGRVGVLATGGGMAVMAADVLMRQGLELPPLSPATIEKMNSILTPRWSHVNPVETGGDMFSYPCLWALIEDENIDAALVIGAAGAAASYARWVNLPPSMRGEVDRWIESSDDSERSDVDKLMELMTRYQKPVVMAHMGIPDMRRGKLYEKMERNHVIPYLTPERAAKALANLVEYSEYLGIAEGRG
jgi:acyl-CoA synthetase (NDP forming)